MCQLAQRGRQCREIVRVCCMCAMRHALCSLSGMAHRVLARARRRPAASPWQPGGPRFLPTGSVIATGVLAALALAPRAAQACRNNEHPVFTISEVTPALESSRVARDTGIIVGATASPPAGPVTFADVALIDAETGVPVPLLPVSWLAFDGSMPTMAFRPTEPLAAWRQYRVEAIPFDEVNGGFGAPVSSSFTTSDALLEPIVLSGEFAFTLRPSEIDRVERVDGDSCGGGRQRVVGKMRQLYIDVQLPVPSGGQGIYHAVMHFTDDAPVRTNIDDAPEPEGWEEGTGHRVQSMFYAHVEPGEALTLSQPLFADDFAYAPCCNFAVWDPAGNLTQASACLPSITPEEITALTEGDEPTELSADVSIASEQIVVAIERANRPDRNAPVWSCALGTSPQRSLPAWLALLPALPLGRRLSRAMRRG
jgi:hypothetical protein